MSIDLSIVTGLSDQYGVITQLELGGRVIWAVQSDKPVILQVEKITSNTYAGETTYNNEQFILLDIYPKTNGTVSVTYGGLTKTITDTSGAEEPNAQKVFFGTFNGVADETPASGELIIEGDYRGFGIGTFAASSKSSNNYCRCITAVKDFGSTSYIAQNAFNGCTGLTSVTIPKSVKTIGTSAFSGCTGLTSAIIQGGDIGSTAFYGCTGLVSVSLENGVTGIGASAFQNCALTGVVAIPASVTKIGTNMWGGCNITGITVDSGNRVCKMDGNCLVHISSGQLVCGFDNSVIPSYVTEIAAYAFKGRTGLTSVTIPASVTKISMSAFENCTGLTSVTIENGVSALDGFVFNGCTGLTSVTIPASVTKIGKSAFKLADGYSRIVTMLSATPPTLSYDDTFDVAGANNFIIPAGSGEVYKTAEYWDEYADYITEAS